METLGLGPFLAGLAMLCVTLGVPAFAAHVLRERFTPGLPPLAAFLATALFWTLAVIVEHLVPLALGVLSKGTVLVAAALMGVAAGVVWLGNRDAGGAGDWRMPWSAPVALVVAAAAAAFVADHGAEATLSSDALNFHIPQLARWMQSGSMWQLDQFYPLYSNATYPHHGNLLMLSVVLPFDHVFLARLVPVPFAVGTCAGVYACARELDAPRGWALLAAALPAAMPLIIKVALDGAQTDMPLTFAVTVATLFLLRHRRTGARSDLVVAGLAVGLAAGTKWYAFSALPPLLLAWGVAIKLGGASWRRSLTDFGILLGVALAVAAPWLIRNLVEAGNPMFPQKLGPFGAPRDIIREQSGFTLLDYVTDTDVIKTYLRPQYDKFFAGPGYVIAAAPLVALIVGIARRAWIPVTIALGALGALVAYTATPFSAFGPAGMPIIAFANMRYALPALLMGAVLVAWVGARSGRFGPVLAVALIAAIAQGLIAEYEFPVKDLITACVALGAAVWIGLKARRRVALAVAALAIGGITLARHTYDISPYTTADPTIAYMVEQAPQGHRVGLAGVWSPDGVSPVLPAFGPRLRNHVAFLGPFREHLLRPETEPQRFKARLKTYDLLVVGRGIAPSGPVPEEQWAREAGFELVTESPRLALLRR